MTPPPDPTRQTAPSIEIGGSRIDDRLASDLLEMRIVRGTRTTGRASLAFVDRTSTLTRSTFKLGDKLSVWAIEPEALLFHGEVTAVGTEADEHGVRAVVTAHDATLPLARKRSVETFTQQTVSDAISTIASAAGLTGSVPSSSTVVDWFWRADSLLGQVDELCERLGWEWILEGEKTLRCIDVSGLRVPESTVTLDLGSTLTRFSAEQSRPTRTEVEVRGWDRAEKTVVTASATTPPEADGFTAAGNPAVAKSVVTRAAVTSQASAQAVAKSLAAGAATVTARGRGPFAPLVQPGEGVRINGAGSSDGTYYVREVEHVFDTKAMRTSFVAGFRAPTLVSDPFHSASAGSSVFASGVRAAVVTNLADPKDLGRVKVKIPAVSDTDELEWARVLSPGGGTGQRGFHWLPDVGDEVLVAFEDGDVARPVVVGGLHSSKDKPPTPKPANGQPVELRTIRSAAGHKIEFNDKDGEQGYIDLELGDGKVRLHLGKDRIDLETSDKPVRIGAGKSEIVLDGQGTITIKAQTLKLDLTQDLQIEAMGVKAKAKGNLELEGQLATVKANGPLKLQSSAIAELSGPMVKIN